MEVRVSRKVDSSAGAGLNGEGMDDVEKAPAAVVLAGGLPEPFLGLGIVSTASDDSEDEWICGSPRPVPNLEAPSRNARIKKYASAKRASPTPSK